MLTLIADIETNGLLVPERGASIVNEVFTLGILVLSDGYYECLTGDRIFTDGIDFLNAADLVVGHNWLGYDLPVLEKLSGRTLRRDNVRDTLAASRFVHRFDNLKIDPELLAGLSDEDIEELMRDLGLRGKDNHGLAAWSRRLKLKQGKQEFDHSRTTGRTWNDLGPELQQELLSYQEGDLHATAAVYRVLEHVWNEFPEAIALEQDVMAILPEQVCHGIRIDIDAARKRVTELEAEIERLTEKLRSHFPPLLTRGEVTAASRNYRTGIWRFVRGAPYTPLSFQVLNPNSNPQMIKRFLARGWCPQIFTEGGQPAFGKAVLKQMPYPEIPDLLALKAATKTLSMVSKGKKSWLNNIGEDGRIRGSVNTCGALTHRMTHSAPNVAQVPKDAHERAVWIASEGMIFVDVDASGLEARLQAHFMARFDDGLFRDVVLSGTDLHEMNQQDADLPSRGCAKAVLYATTYGAQNPRLGQIILTHAAQAGLIDRFPEDRDEWEALGAKARTVIYKNMPGLRHVVEEAQKEFETNGFVVGLDGRRFYPGGKHSAFNTKVQGGGSIVMKRALKIFYDWPGRLPCGVKMCANVHDEWLLECPPEYAAEVASRAKSAISEAGEFYGLSCPLDGASAIGTTWADVH